MNAAAQNRATNDRAQTFNLGVDQVNLQQSNTEKENFARDQAAYRNAKREYITGIGEGIGDIGKEQIFKQMAEKMTGYDWMGNYLKLNPNATPEEVDKAYKEEQSKKKTSIVENKYGGLMKLNFKKY